LLSEITDQIFARSEAIIKDSMKNMVTLRNLHDLSENSEKRRRRIRLDTSRSYELFAAKLWRLQ